ncbi:hypothetical protein PR048_023084, partial [Dryococelus australis]
MFCQGEKLNWLRLKERSFKDCLLQFLLLGLETAYQPTSGTHEFDRLSKVVHPIRLG